MQTLHATKQSKNEKDKTTKDSKNTNNPGSSHPYTQRQLDLKRKTQADLSSSQITYPEKLPNQDIFSEKLGSSIFAILGDQKLKFTQKIHQVKKIKVHQTRYRTTVPSMR